MKSTSLHTIPNTFSPQSQIVWLIPAALSVLDASFQLLKSKLFLAQEIIVLSIIPSPQPIPI